MTSGSLSYIFVHTVWRYVRLKFSYVPPTSYSIDAKRIMLDARHYVCNK